MNFLRSKVVYWLSLCALCCGASAQNSLGFRGALMGQPPLPDMQRLEKWKPLIGVNSREISDTYTRPTDSMNLGDVKIKEIVYEYFDNQLFKIEIDLWVGNQSRCHKVSELIAALEQQYQIKMHPHQSDYAKSEFLFQWRGAENWITYICQPWAQLNTLSFQNTRLATTVESRLKSMSEHDSQKSTDQIRRGM